MNRAVYSGLRRLRVCVGPDDPCIKLDMIDRGLFECIGHDDAEKPAAVWPVACNRPGRLQILRRVHRLSDAERQSRFAQRCVAEAPGVSREELH
jgi:hypothetical protein